MVTPAPRATAAMVASRLYQRVRCELCCRGWGAGAAQANYDAGRAFTFARLYLPGFLSRADAPQPHADRKHDSAADHNLDDGVGESSAHEAPANERDGEELAGDDD